MTARSQAVAPAAPPAVSADSSTVVVFLDQRYSRTPDGRVWTESLFPYTFFERYLRVFDHVRAVARVRDVPTPPDHGKPADGPGVEVAQIPYYIGMTDYLGKRRAVRQAAISAIGPTDTVLLRVPGQISTCVEGWLKQRNRPYGVEVVGDPYDAYAPGAVRHPLRPLFRYWFHRRVGKQVEGAKAAAYVTREVLQRRFPAPAADATAHYSSIELPAEAFVHRPRVIDQTTNPLRIITVGSLESFYKGPDVLIEALARCTASGLDAELSFVGGGRCMPALQDQAKQAGLTRRVRFLGQLRSGATVYKELDRADLFVLPSRAEGLPRAMIEAMARALPALGSNVGGIPELLPPEDLVPVGDADMLANAILRAGRDTGGLAAMSARNLVKAQEYGEDVLRDRRDSFYRHLRELTATPTR